MKRRKIFLGLIIITSIIIIITLIFISLNSTKQAQENNTLSSKNQEIVLKKDELTNNIKDILKNSFDENELNQLSLAINIPKYNYDYSYNDSLQLHNASTIKVPLNLYIYDLAKDNPKILDKKIKYLPQHYEEGSGIMQAEKYYTSFDVQTLLTNSIKYSDNIATNMLFDEFIKSDSYKELIPYFDNADYENWLSNSLNKIHSLKYLYSNQDQYPTLIKDMKESIYRTRVPSLLPENLEVALKTGDINATVHDMAIVFDKDNIDYLITISMDSISNDDEKMAKLSKDIYNLIIDFAKEI